MINLFSSLQSLRNREESREGSLGEGKARLSQMELGERVQGHHISLRVHVRPWTPSCGMPVDLDPCLGQGSGEVIPVRWGTPEPPHSAAPQL